MTLVSLPDICKKQPKRFTLGFTYQVLGIFGNSYIVLDNTGERCIVLQERFV